MTASGHERRYGSPDNHLHVRFAPIATINRVEPDVSKGPTADLCGQANEYAGMPYSITSSARATSVAGR